MFLHIGGEYIIKTKYIVGMFDMDNSTVSASTRNFLARAEKKGLVVYTTRELPRTFIIYKEKKFCRIYVTQLSCATLQKRNTERRG